MALFSPETRHSDPHTLQSLDPRLTAVFPQLYGSSQLSSGLETLTCQSVSPCCPGAAPGPASAGHQLHSIPFSQCVKFHQNVCHVAHQPSPLPIHILSCLFLCVLRGKSSECGPVLDIRILIWFGTKVEIPAGSVVGHMEVLSSWSPLVPSRTQPAPCTALSLPGAEHSRGHS